MKKGRIVVAAILLTAMLGGCGDSPGMSSQTPTPGNVQSTASPGAQTPESNFEGYPLKAEDTTISWWVGAGFLPNSAYGSGDQSPFHSGLSEMTGVKIEWQFPTAGTDASQAFNLMLASDTLPDIIYYGLISDAGRYIDEGIIRDLSDNIADYSPAYYQFLQTDPVYDKSMKTDSGQYYGYGFFREDGGWNDSYLGPVIRQDWLDALGLSAPKTISDWDKVLSAFKDKYNAKLSFAWSRFKTTGISGAFGSYSAIDHRVYIDDNGKLQSAQAQPQWKAYMAKLNEWWKAGLIDQDVLTMTDTDAQTKALNGNIGISVTSMGQVSNWEKDADKAGNGAKWTGLQYPTGDDGTLSMVFGGRGIGGEVSVVTTSCAEEKLETVMRVLDYAYTDEGHLYWNFGKEGVSWEYDSEGKPAYTDLVTKDPDGLNNAIDKYGGSTWSGSTIQATLLLYLKNTKTAVEANDLWFYPNEAVTTKHNMPRVTFTVDESNRLAELNAPINTYVSETAVKYLVGEESLDTFDSFVAKLYDMGLQEVLDINQAAYDRFLAR